MALTFDSKIKELEQSKSELDLNFLECQKKEFEEKMYEILDNQNEGIDENNAISELKKIKSYRSKIKETEEKIQNNSNFMKDIDKKISFYMEKKEWIKKIPLYRDTEKWIAEILWWDPVYQFAKETNKGKIAKKLEERCLSVKEYETLLGNMYKELLKNYEKKKKEINLDIPKKVEILLPEWMSEQIKEELKDDKLLNPQDIEKFLKNELKKNAWDIMISHIKNKFKDNFSLAYEYIKKLIINYPWFNIIENHSSEKLVTSPKSKREKLISSISQEEIENHKNERLRKNKLIVKLNEIWKIEDLKTRISKYFDLFEELNHNFANRNEFESYVIEIITHTHRWIEKEIVKTLNWLIQWNTHMEKTLVYKYNVYKFNRGNRRMIAYPNWKIFTLCPHEEYERIINTQPPADKTE